jgi:hypothetical protein
VGIYSVIYIIYYLINYKIRGYFGENINIKLIISFVRIFLNPFMKTYPMKKKSFLSLYLLTGILVNTSAGLSSQDTLSHPFTMGADINSAYIWRGTRYGQGPVIQPVLKFKSGFFTAGAWGSFDFHNYQETDLFVSFALPAGFTIGMTDYYYPGLDYFDYSVETGSHAFEINGGFSKGGLALAANYIINAAGSAGSDGNDIYLEAKYSFRSFFILAGAGDGWHSLNHASGADKFALCNLAIGTSRTIKVTGTFEIPVSGQVVCNPDAHRLYIVIGFTL